MAKNSEAMAYNLSKINKQELQFLAQVNDGYEYLSLVAQDGTMVNGNVYSFMNKAQREGDNVVVLYRVVEKKFKKLDKSLVASDGYRLEYVPCVLSLEDGRELYLSETMDEYVHLKGNCIQVTSRSRYNGTAILALDGTEVARSATAPYENDNYLFIINGSLYGKDTHITVIPKADPKAKIEY